MGLGKVDALPGSSGGPFGLPVEEVRSGDLQDMLLPSPSVVISLMFLQKSHTHTHTHNHYRRRVGAVAAGAVTSSPDWPQALTDFGGRRGDPVRQSGAAGARSCRNVPSGDGVEFGGFSRSERT